MKISILAVTIEQDEKDEEPGFKTEPVRKPFTPDDQRAAGPQTSPGPSGGRHLTFIDLLEELKPDGPIFKV